MVTLYKRQQIIAFFTLLLLVLVLVLFMLKPFVNILALGVILAVLFYPIYYRILVKIKSSNLAAFLTVLLFLVIILVPLVFFGQILLNELINLYGKFRGGDLVINKAQIIAGLPPQVQSLIENLSRGLNNFLGNFTSNIFQSVSGIISNIAGFLFSLFLVFFSFFFLLRDGEKIKKVFMDISPIAASQENILFERIVAAVNGVVKGSFLTALTQGAMATIGFFIFGIPEPIVWGLFTVLTALVPAIGTSLSLVPAVVYLVITGHVPQAIGLAIWGAVGVGLIDNFVGPKLVGSRTKLHPLLVLLSVIGGLQFFGLLGFLIGPILMAIFVALIDMYRTDFKDYIQSS